MPTEIKDKYSTSAALTATLASLASSASRVGRQSTMVDNSTTRYQQIIVYYKITQGTSPTGSKRVSFYAIRGDKDGTTAHRDGAAGASDAAWTAPADMQPIHEEFNKSSPSTGDVLQGSFVIDNPGPEWGVGLWHDTGVDLNGTAGNHWIRWVGVNPEAQ